MRPWMAIGLENPAKTSVLLGSHHLFLQNAVGFQCHLDCSPLQWQAEQWNSGKEPHVSNQMTHRNVKSLNKRLSTMFQKLWFHPIIFQLGMFLLSALSLIKHSFLKIKRKNAISRIERTSNAWKLYPITFQPTYPINSSDSVSSMPINLCTALVLHKQPPFGGRMSDHSLVIMCALYRCTRLLISSFKKEEKEGTIWRARPRANYIKGWAFYSRKDSTAHIPSVAPCLFFFMMNNTTLLSISWTQSKIS